MTAEIVRLQLPSKSAEESKKDYYDRFRDGRSASKTVERSAFAKFGIRSAPKKGEDGYDDQTGVKVEHKMLVKSAYMRRSQFTGDNRLCLPSDVIECCEKDYVISYVLGEIPFSVRISSETIKEWLKSGYIDPVTGCLNKNCFLFLVRPFDTDHVLPSPAGQENPSQLQKLAFQRIQPNNIARRVKKKVDTYEQKCFNRIKEGREQQEFYEKQSHSG